MRESQLQVFYEPGKLLTLNEAKSKAQLFYDYAKNICKVNFYGDYWFGIADNYDLNIWCDDDSEVYQLTLYEVINGKTNTSDNFTTFLPV
jgi:hypothetical protein